MRCWLQHNGEGPCARAGPLACDNERRAGESATMNRDQRKRRERYIGEIDVAEAKVIRRILPKPGPRNFSRKQRAILTIANQWPGETLANIATLAGASTPTVSVAFRKAR